MFTCYMISKAKNITFSFSENVLVCMVYCYILLSLHGYKVRPPIISSDSVHEGLKTDLALKATVGSDCQSELGVILLIIPTYTFC